MITSIGKVGATGNVSPAGDAGANIFTSASFRIRIKDGNFETISRMVLPIHSAGSQKSWSMGYIFRFFTMVTKDRRILVTIFWKKNLSSNEYHTHRKRWEYISRKIYRHHFKEATGMTYWLWTIGGAGPQQSEFQIHRYQSAHPKYPPQISSRYANVLCLKNLWSWKIDFSNADLSPVKKESLAIYFQQWRRNTWQEK